MNIPFRFQGDVGPFHQADEPVVELKIALCKRLLANPFRRLNSLSSGCCFKSSGGDGSKSALAVCYPAQERLPRAWVSRSAAGRQQLVRRGGVATCFVLETTGGYHRPRAHYLVEQGAQVAVPTRWWCTASANGTRVRTKVTAKTPSGCYAALSRRPCRPRPHWSSAGDWSRSVSRSFGKGGPLEIGWFNRGRGRQDSSLAISIRPPRCGNTRSSSRSVSDARRWFVSTAPSSAGLLHCRP